MTSKPASPMATAEAESQAPEFPESQPLPDRFESPASPPHGEKREREDDEGMDEGRAPPAERAAENDVEVPALEDAALEDADLGIDADPQHPLEDEFNRDDLFEVIGGCHSVDSTRCVVVRRRLDGTAIQVRLMESDPEDKTLPTSVWTDTVFGTWPSSCTAAADFASNAATQEAFARIWFPRTPTTVTMITYLRRAGEIRIASITMPRCVIPRVNSALIDLLAQRHIVPANHLLKLWGKTVYVTKVTPNLCVNTPINVFFTFPPRSRMLAGHDCE
jgi:hypothetical protein